MRLLLGVDEAGRGPLAGPVAVGVVAAPENFNVVRAFPGLADSKRVSEAVRLELFKLLRERARAGELTFCVRYSSAAVIDKRGITRAVQNAVSRAVRFLAPGSSDVRVLLDGLLTAPEEYDQQTIIGGDEAVPLIALASIAAKVLRDRRMMRLAKIYPEYGFDEHKGYGTAFHLKAIKKHGPSDMHRRSYIHLAGVKKKK